MWPDRVSNPGPLPLESDALPTALSGPAVVCVCVCVCVRERERERERERAYTGMSPVGKIIAIFSWGKNYYMYVEKLPYLSSD